MSAPDALKRISGTVWELPPSFRPGMQVPVRVFADEELIETMDDAVFEQAANVATLPGIVGYSFCMPDGHRGYGFPIGGVAAFDPEVGVISPGGIGFDINCGMRLVRTNLTEEEVRPRLEELVDRLYAAIPAGVGGSGMISLGESEFSDLLAGGLEWARAGGYAVDDDLDHTEEGGRMAGANPELVSSKAVSRGRNQVGTLGSGNHYLEIQVSREADRVAPEPAERLGLDRPDQVVLMLHTGSRGFGHQVATDYLREFVTVMNDTYDLGVQDRELACAPFRSEEGQRYFAAMQCAVNMAFCNRQLIIHRTREVFCDVFGRSPEDLGMRQIYDVTHNTAKLETHRIAGEERDVLVHRKGATRAFPPGSADLPEDYRDLGQPVIIGGSMETGSYLLLGPAAPLSEEYGGAFGTTAHGSGRVMGRRAAKKQFWGEDVQDRMRSRGIYVRAVSKSGLAEEAGGAYKSIDAVVDAADAAGLSRKVARLVPIGNIKG